MVAARHAIARPSTRPSCAVATCSSRASSTTPRSAFRVALQLDAKNPRVLALLGLTYFRAGQFAAGAPDLRGARRARADRRVAPAQPRARLPEARRLRQGDRRARGEPRARSEPGPRGQLSRPRVRARRSLRRGVPLVPARRSERARDRDRDQPDAAERDGIHSQLAALRRSSRAPAPPKPPIRVEREIRARTRHAGDRDRSPDPTDDDRARPLTAATTASAPSRVRAAASERSDAVGDAERDEHAGDRRRVVIGPRPRRRRAAPMPAIARATDRGASTPAIRDQRARAERLAAVRAAERSAVPTPADGPVDDLARGRGRGRRRRAARRRRHASASGCDAAAPLSELATEILDPPRRRRRRRSRSHRTVRWSIRVTERVLTRLDGVHVTGGELDVRAGDAPLARPPDRGAVRLRRLALHVGRRQGLPDRGRRATRRSPRSRSTTTSSTCARTSSSRSRRRCAGRTATCPACAASCPSCSSAATARSRCAPREPLVRVKLPAQGVRLRRRRRGSPAGSAA